jgi:hypothetical protein
MHKGGNQRVGYGSSKTEIYLSEHLLPMSPVCTHTGEGIGLGYIIIKIVINLNYFNFVF